MPYWPAHEKAFDRNGKEIRPGDILESTWDRCNDGPLRFVCFVAPLGHIEVRDLCHNNVAMCCLGTNGDVINLGCFCKNPGILDAEDLEHYFGISRPLRHIGDCSAFIPKD